MESRLKSEEQQSKSLSLIQQLRDFGIGPIVGMFISIITVPVTTRLITPDEFGKTSLFTLLQTLFSLTVLLGMDQSYVRFYNRDNIEKKHLFYTSLWLPIVFCSLIIVIIEVFRKQISFFLFGLYEPLIMWSFVVFLPSLLLNRFCILSVRMSLKGKLYSYLQIFVQLLNLILLIVFLVFYEKSFRAVVFSNILAVIIGTVIIEILSTDFSLLSLIRSVKKIDKELLRQLFIYGIPFLPSSIVIWGMNGFDKFALRTWCDFKELGLYVVAFKIVAVLNVIQSIFTTAWTPIAYKWYEENVSPKKFERVSLLVLATMTLLFSILIISRRLIIKFLGNEYRNASLVFIFLLFGPLLLTVSETVGLGINFKKKTFWNLYISLFAMIVNIIGNYVLVRKCGALGAAISTCICNVISFWSRILISYHVWYMFSIWEYFVDIFLLIGYCVIVLLSDNILLEWTAFFIIISFNVFLFVRTYLQKTKGSHYEVCPCKEI